MPELGGFELASRKVTAEIFSTRIFIRHEFTSAALE
jgi:hypothetical protein